MASHRTFLYSRVPGCYSVCTGETCVCLAELDMRQTDKKQHRQWSTLITSKDIESVITDVASVEETPNTKAKSAKLHG